MSNKKMSNLTTKLMMAIATAVLGIGAMEVSPVAAASFSFTQTGYSAGGSVTGTFEGSNTNSDDLLELTELNSFSADYSGILGAKTWSLTDLSSFSYGITSNTILDLFASNSLGEIYCSSCASGNSAVGDFQVFEESSESILVVADSGDGDGVSVPEPGTAIALSIMGLGGLFYRKKKAA